MWNMNDKDKTRSQDNNMWNMNDKDKTKKSI